MLERRIKDPRLGFVTVTEARVTGDLREATVYYTVYGSPDEVAGTAHALASATGLIRSEVGRETGIKHTPSITFVEDKLPDNARAIEDLVAKARQADAEVAAVRADAEHAGEADPYRQPTSRVDEDDLAGNDLVDDQFDDDLDDDDELEDDVDDDDLDDDDELDDDLDDDELEDEDLDDDELEDDDLEDDVDDDDDELDVDGEQTGPLGNYPGRAGNGRRSARP
jgi:ribosome-binding factor A